MAPVNSPIARTNDDCTTTRSNGAGIFVANVYSARREASSAIHPTTQILRYVSRKARSASREAPSRISRVNSAPVGLPIPSLAAEFQIDQRDTFIACGRTDSLLLNITARRILHGVSGPQ